jgi:hypothetical protein
MKFQESHVSTKKTTSERMLGCYILCSEILVEVDRLMIEGRGGSTTVKVKVDRKQVEGQGSRLRKFKDKDIDDKSTDKRLKCGHEKTDW